MIITIDGPAGSGKSTIAKKVAVSLGFTYFDTGAMYRAMAWGLLRDNIDITDINAVATAISNYKLDIRQIDEKPHYFLDEEDITASIRTEQLSRLASTTSAQGAVRHRLVALQKKLALGVDAVFEGRDMGTVVFPEADVKVFLTATAEERAKRRMKDLNGAMSYEQILESINQRDKDDASREMSPMKPADDAHLLDTSDLTIEEVTEKILEFIPDNKN